jgi:hypothetical protein
MAPPRDQQQRQRRDQAAQEGEDQQGRGEDRQPDGQDPPPGQAGGNRGQEQGAGQGADPAGREQQAVGAGVAVQDAHGPGRHQRGEGHAEKAGYRHDAQQQPDPRVAGDIGDALAQLAHRRASGCGPVRARRMAASAAITARKERAFRLKHQPGEGGVGQASERRPNGDGRVEQGRVRGDGVAQGPAVHHLQHEGLPGRRVERCPAPSRKASTTMCQGRTRPVKVNTASTRASSIMWTGSGSAGAAAAGDRPAPAEQGEQPDRDARGEAHVAQVSGGERVSWNTR